MKVSQTLFLACVMVGGLALGWVVTRPDTLKKVVLVDCADIVAGCSLPVSGLEVAFDRRPQPMRPFVLRVQQTGAKAVYASFSMRGMEMGLTRYRLLSQVDGVWQAEVVLPVCIQGRSDWELLLELDAGRYALPFSAGERLPGQER